MPLVLDGTNGVSGVDGTASNPAIEGTDSNTGIFYPAADTVAIGTGGTERLRVVSAGDVGVGTSTPATISNRTVLSINNASNGGALNLLVNGTETLRLLTDNSSFGYVYNIANQPLVFGTNGNERMRIDASGNVGINDTSPSSRGLLSVKLSDGRHFAVGSNAQPVARYDDNGVPTFQFQNYGITAANQGYQMLWSFGDAIGNAGNAGAIRVATEQAWTSTASTRDAYMAFFTGLDGNTFERARITSGGSFCINTSNDASGARLVIINTAASARMIQMTKGDTNDYFIVADSSSVNRFLVSGSGQITSNTLAGGATTLSVDAGAAIIRTPSDASLKTNIQPIQYGLETVLKLKPVSHEWVEEINMGGASIGFIAQDMEQEIPEVVSGIEYKSIDYPKLAAVLTKAIQELNAKVEAQAAEIAALKGNA